MVWGWLNRSHKITIFTHLCTVYNAGCQEVFPRKNNGCRHFWIQNTGSCSWLGKKRLNRLFVGVGYWPRRESANNVGIMLLGFNADNTRDAIDELKGKGYPFISK